MKARFHIDSTFTIPSQNLLVLAGELRSGEITSGMEILIPGGLGVVTILKIHRIESISSSIQRSLIGLAVQCHGKDELSSLKSLQICKTEVDVCSPESEAP